MEDLQSVQPLFQQPVSVKYTEPGYYEFNEVSDEDSVPNLCFSSPQALKVGERVNVTLMLPSGSAQRVPMHIQGTVVQFQKLAPVQAFSTLVIAPNYNSEASHV